MKIQLNEIKRKFYYRQLSRRNDLAPIIKEYLAATYININESFLNSRFLVLDFETTGLNPKTDKILSIGYTTIENGKIQLKNSKHFYCQHLEKISDESVKIHHITEQKAAKGIPIEQIIPEIINDLKNSVLVAHYADIEVNFLQRIIKDLYHITLPLLTIDTLQIAYQEKYRNSIVIEQNALNLFNLRKQAGLPRYKAHNALSDAIATAELLLVQVAHKNNSKDVPLKMLL